MGDEARARVKASFVAGDTPLLDVINSPEQLLRALLLQVLYLMRSERTLMEHSITACCSVGSFR